MVEARVIAATNRNLTQMVKKGAFRQGFYSRLEQFEDLLAVVDDGKEEARRGFTGLAVDFRVDPATSPAPHGEALEG